MSEQGKRGRLERAAIGLTLLAAGLAAGGLVLARYDVLPKLTGFAGLALGGAVALLALLCGLIALWSGRGQRLAGRKALVAATLVALGLGGFVASRPLVARGIPAIHDISTDLANPPEFRALPLRADNLAGVETIDNWRKLHAAAYGDIAPLHSDKPVATMLVDARRQAEAQGWTIAAFDPNAGRMEATASVSFIRFQDDVVLVAQPGPQGQGSIVNMRSVSRIGISDFGVNAKRVRDFLKVLAAH
ncbi:DUF1499 domain-containing protein [Novosphingobium sp. B 225]|uniref:DUF1499 domain-containing protein n=1 Tax=Novosphingobium sp. B 225 TaxID=1961849 RepID=UPI0015963A85|nr:DUF1499 domain-containing protein [Novosphingobium sp. B 225]